VVVSLRRHCREVVALLQLPAGGEDLVVVVLQDSGVLHDCVA
jgi:RNase P protein component